MPDWTIKQADSAPTFSDTLTWNTGAAVDLTGASVKFVMRSRTATSPAVNATATIVTAAAGTVSYTPSASDTATAGHYTSYWTVTFANAVVQRFPTVGFNTVEVQENLETANQTIVELDDVKQYLNFPSTERSHDGELATLIAGVTPVVEGIVGPIVPRTYTAEAYDGGSPFIQLRHRPVISVSAVTEYWGSVAYTLAQVATPDLGSTYSYSFEAGGRLVRRNAGGGTQAFPSGFGSVLVTYIAGRAVTPPNVRLATLELVRVNYQQTQQGGRPTFGSPGQEDSFAGYQMLGFFVPNRVRELLASSKRAPSIA